MAENLNDLFEVDTKVTISGRGLPGTAQLVSLCNTYADSIIRVMNAKIDQYRDTIQVSAKSATAMDQLVNTMLIERSEDDVDCDIHTDAAFLKDLDDGVIDGMLKSQQSKRSRCKSKAMTVDNYKQLLSASIAECVLRTMCDRPKQSAGRSASGFVVNYTAAQLEALSNDVEALKKAIRNVQSKKSILKSREGFDPSSEPWQQLLKAEALLKDMRVSATMDETRHQLQELLTSEGVNLDSLEHLRVSDARRVLTEVVKLAKHADADDHEADEATDPSQPEHAESTENNDNGAVDTAAAE